MTVMTDIIILMQWEESNLQGEYPMIARLNDYFHRDPESYYSQPGSPLPFQQLMEQCKNGIFGRGIVHADINHLDLADFFEYLASLSWDRSDLLQVLIRREDEMSHSLYVICDGKFVKRFEGEKF